MLRLLSPLKAVRVERTAVEVLLAELVVWQAQVSVILNTTAVLAVTGLITLVIFTELVAVRPGRTEQEITALPALTVETAVQETQATAELGQMTTRTPKPKLARNGVFTALAVVVLATETADFYMTMEEIMVAGLLVPLQPVGRETAVTV